MNRPKDNTMFCDSARLSNENFPKLTFPKCPRPNTLTVLKFFMLIVEDTGDVVLPGLRKDNILMGLFSKDEDGVRLSLY